MRIVTRELPRLERAKFATHLRALVAESGEADARLELPPASPASIAQVLFDERVGMFDYALKSQFDTARRLILAGVLTVPPFPRRK